jgi:hypothetical protein
VAKFLDEEAKLNRRLFSKEFYLLAHIFAIWVLVVLELFISEMQLSHLFIALYFPIKKTYAQTTSDYIAHEQLLLFKE